MGVRGIDYHRRQGTLQSTRNGKDILIEFSSLDRLARDKSPDRDISTEISESSIVWGAPRPISVQTNDEILRELSSRIEFLESRAGVRPVGMTKVFLVSLQEAVLRARNSDLKNPEFRGRLIDAAEMMDYEAVRLCAENPNIIELPYWLMRTMHRIADSASDRIERTKALMASRNLRLTLRSFQPPGKLVQCQFPIFAGISPVDCLIISSHTRVSP
jgi:hypothetical protein